MFFMEHWKLPWLGNQVIKYRSCPGMVMGMLLIEGICPGMVIGMLLIEETCPGMVIGMLLIEGTCPGMVMWHATD